MKKVLFTALTLPLIFAACSNEDFETQQTSDNNNGDLIELDANFALGINKDAPDTRAEYDTSTGRLLFEWMPEVGDQDALTPDRVGLCWTGQTPDGKAYTNYEFTHFAWAKQGATPDVDPCEDYKWKNLVFLSQAEKTAMGATGAGNGNEYVTRWSGFAVSGGAPVKGSGYFKTCNMTIFKGDYLLYTPFNETFYESDNLVAVSNKAFNVTASTTAADAFKGIANEIFCVGTAAIEGGKTANGFSLSPLSGMIRVRLKKDAQATKSWNNIEKVAIYSAANGGIITQQAIDGRKVNAAKAAGNMAQCLVEGDIRERSTSLFATVETVFEIGTSKTDIIIPALPQTITDAQVVIFDEDGKSAMINVDDIVVKSNSLANVEITLTDANALQTDVFYVVDMETFADAMHQSYAKTDGANVKVTVKLLNDIIYDIAKTDDSTNGLVYVNKNMTIEGGKIIIPNDNKLMIELQANKTLTVKSNIEIQGKNCCGDKVGDVIVYGSGSSNTSKYVFDGQIDNYGRFQIGNVSNQTNAQFNGKVNNLDGADDAENNGGKEQIIIISKTNAVFMGDVVNEGSFVTDRQHTTAVGNYTTINNFQNNGVVTVAKVTTLTVAKDATFTNNGSLTVDTNNGINQSLDGTIDNQGTIVNNKVISNKGVINTYGSLSNGKAGAEIYDYVGCQFGGNKASVPEGTEYICDVDNSKITSGNRLAYALDSKMPTTTVRFVKGSANDAEHKYDLKDYKDYTKLATVKYIIDTENGGAENSIGNFQLSNSGDTEITFGTSVVVEKARNLKFMSGKIKVDGPITVKAGFMMNETDASVTVAGNVTMADAATDFTVKPVKNAAAATEKTTPNWVVNGNVILNATSSKLNVTQKAAFDLNGTLTINKGNTAFFGYSSYTDVKDVIAIDGTFTRELSSGTATANPAKVWCENFTKGSNAVITNGLPETR